MNQQDLDDYRRVLVALSHYEILSIKDALLQITPAELADVDDAAKKWLKGLLDEIEIIYHKNTLVAPNEERLFSKPQFSFTDPLDGINRELEENAKKCMDGFLEENKKPIFSRQKMFVSRRRALRDSRGKVNRKL